MRIGLDAMGGDYAPGAAVDGVLLAREWMGSEVEVVLYGDEGALREEFSSRGASLSDYQVVHCGEVITMHDHPVQAIAKKSDSSITVGFQHLSCGQIDGFASAGNTGAMMAGTMSYIKPIAGILRPGIAAYIPVGEDGYNLLLDVGLNVDCKPEVLLQYGQLGSLYSRFIFGIAEPRVGLLSIGGEPEKGNAAVKQAHELMRDSGTFRFIGNVEGNELLSNARVDVVVADGFVGNVSLKLAESFYLLTRERRIDDAVFDRYNFEHYGGTPVLGVNAPVIIGHGVSTGKAISNMLRQASLVISSGLCETFKGAFSNV